MSDALEQVYERHLLGIARRECEPFGGMLLVLTRHPNGESAEWAARTHAPGWGGCGDTPADALCALLRDLGVEPPARPSVDQMAGAQFDVGKFGAMPRWRALYARDPLLAESILAVGP